MLGQRADPDRKALRVRVLLGRDLSAALSSADHFPTVAAAQNAVRDMPVLGA
jgi:hypothetical protein